MAKKEKETKVKKDGFFKKMNKELKLVRWPSFKELVKYTGATILFVIIFVLFFQLVDILSSFVKGLF